MKENPFGLLLLDEFEKAHPDILNLFLQILDEGYVNDVFGQRVYFTNHIIIATSNAGSAYLAQLLKKGWPYEKVAQAVSDYLVKERIYRPELLNRFDKVIYFKPLGPREIYAIARLKLNKLAQELYRLRRIHLEVEPRALKILAELGYNPQFGARELERVIRERIEALLARKIIAGEIQEGEKVLIKASDLLAEAKKS